VGGKPNCAEPCRACVGAAPGTAALDVQLDRAATALANSLTSESDRRLPDLSFSLPLGLSWSRPRVSAFAAILLACLSSLIASCAPIGNTDQDAPAAISEDMAAAHNLGRPSSLSPGERTSEGPPQAYPWVND
jgi:hypothetical protein